MRHRLSDEERLAGVEASLASSKTPQSLKAGLRQYRDQLRVKIGGGASRRKAKRGSFLSRWLQL